MKLQKNKTVKISLTMILMICFGVVSSLVWGRISENTFALASIKTPDINVKKQKDTPLVISATYADLNALKPTYGYSLTNVSDKTIRAFTIQGDAFYGRLNIKESGATFSHLTSKKLLLRPNESCQETAGGNATYTEEVNEIVLSVDFVEFDDGTTWGVDYYKSKEQLEGQRAGARVALENFRKKLETSGFEMFSKEIDKDSIDFALQADTSKSSKWKNGFQSGIGIVRNRLKRAIDNLGYEGVKQELQKPFDASGGREEK